MLGKRVVAPVRVDQTSVRTPLAVAIREHHVSPLFRRSFQAIARALVTAIERGAWEAANASPTPSPTASWWSAGAAMAAPPGAPTSRIVVFRSPVLLRVPHYTLCVTGVFFATACPHVDVVVAVGEDAQVSPTTYAGAMSRMLGRGWCMVHAGSRVVVISNGNQCVRVVPQSVLKPLMVALASDTLVLAHACRLPKLPARTLAVVTSDCVLDPEDAAARPACVVVDS